MRSRRTAVLVVVFLALGAAGAWVWMSWAAGEEPDPEAVQRAQELQSNYKDTGAPTAQDSDNIAEEENLPDSETRGPGSVSP